MVTRTAASDAASTISTSRAILSRRAAPGPACLACLACLARPCLPRLPRPACHACLAKPRRASPSLACRACLALPIRALPSLACRALPRLAMPCLPRPARPGLAAPSHACLAPPGRALPRRTLPAARRRVAMAGLLPSCPGRDAYSEVSSRNVPNPSPLLAFEKGLPSPMPTCSPARASRFTTSDALN